MSTDLALFQQIWTEVQALRKRLSELEHHDTAYTALPLRDSVGTPATAATIGQIFVYSGDVVRIRFGDGTVREFTTTLVTVADSLLDFSDDDMSMLLGAI